jgi:protein-S-isoprenylcysteine O-methyltransferase Ste14
MKSLGMVTIQLMAIAGIALTTNLDGLTLGPIFIFSLGISIGILALKYMKESRFNVFPDPLEGAKLVTKGIYKQIRHPMYLAVLLSTFGLLLSDLTLLRIAMYLCLLIDILIKMEYEEKRLREAFSEYQDYVSRSKKLIPYIY